MSGMILQNGMSAVASRGPSLEQLIKALQASWGIDTCFEASEWSRENPARGQCVVSSLVVQEFFEGDLLRYEVTNTVGLHEMHYCNILPDGTILDTTGSQYKQPVTLKVKPVDLKGYSSIRGKRLADELTRTRYQILLHRVNKELEKLNG